jgi:hypothetical protein
MAGSFFLVSFLFGFLSLVSSLGSSLALAATAPENAGLGKDRALEVVSAVSAEQTATSETKLQKLPSIGILPESLTSRLEVTAGAVSLYNVTDVTRQTALFAEGRYRLSEAVQLGGSLALRFQGADRGWDAAIQALFGPTFNLVPDSGIQNAFFISPKIGPTFGHTVVDQTSVDSATHLTFALSAGKRFAFSQHIAYVPSVGAVKDLNSTVQFQFQPVAVSIFF